MGNKYQLVHELPVQYCADAVALVIESMPEFYTQLSLNTDELVKYLERLLQADNSELSRKICVMDSAGLAAIMCFYPLQERKARQTFDLSMLMRLYSDPRGLMKFLQQWSEGVGEFPEQGLYLARIAVDSKRRKQGMASVLLDEFEIAARRENIDNISCHVAIENEPAIALYRNKGFVPEGDTGYSRILMHKHLV
jgi:ribosomal protein S18 acetylase RimI-like enzyme